jgi:hypothetical protein
MAHFTKKGEINVQIDSFDISLLREDLVALKKNIINFSNNDVPKLEKLNDNIERLTKSLERQNFIQEWEMAKKYFEEKRVGTVPSDEVMINWIVRNRARMEEIETKVSQHSRGSK